MILLIFLLGLALALGTFPVDLYGDGIHESIYLYQGRAYKYVLKPLTWAEAEEHCVRDQSHLVSIHSLKEDAFVRQVIKMNTHQRVNVWIGFTDIKENHKWKWSDGCEVNYSDWHYSVVNHRLRGGRGDCAQLNYYKEDKWTDVKCNLRNPSVCASPINCTAAPAAFFKKSHRRCCTKYNHSYPYYF